MPSSPAAFSPFGNGQGIYEYNVPKLREELARVAALRPDLLERAGLSSDDVSSYLVESPSAQWGADDPIPYLNAEIVYQCLSHPGEYFVFRAKGFGLMRADSDDPFDPVVAYNGLRTCCRRADGECVTCSYDELGNLVVFEDGPAARDRLRSELEGVAAGNLGCDFLSEEGFLSSLEFPVEGASGQSAVALETPVGAIEATCDGSTVSIDLVRPDGSAFQLATFSHGADGCVEATAFVGSPDASWSMGAAAAASLADRLRTPSSRAVAARDAAGNARRTSRPGFQSRPGFSA